MLRSRPMRILGRLGLPAQSLALRTLALCAMMTAWTFVGCGSSSPSESTGASGASGSGAGSTGDQGGSSGQTQSCGASAVSWKEDGVEHCAQTAEAIEGSTTAEDFLDGGRETYTTLEVVIEQTNTTYIFSFSVTSSSSLDETYGCTASPTGGAELVYDEVGGFSTTVASCNIVVSVAPVADGGMVASGTFSAVLNVTDGGTKTLTDGAFSLPIIMAH